MRHRLARMSKPSVTAPSAAAAADGADDGVTSSRPEPVAEGVVESGGGGGTDGGGGWWSGMRHRRHQAEANAAGGGASGRQAGAGGGSNGGKLLNSSSSSGGGGGRSVLDALTASVREREELRAQLKEDEEEREEKPPHTIVIKIMVSYLQVTSVARSLDLEYPAFVNKLFNIGLQASSAVSTFVSLDCSLPSNGLSKAIQRTIITVALPGIFALLALPVWLTTYLLRARSQRRAVPEPGPALPPGDSGLKLPDPGSPPPPPPPPPTSGAASAAASAGVAAASGTLDLSTPEGRKAYIIRGGGGGGGGGTEEEEGQQQGGGSGGGSDGAGSPGRRQEGVVRVAGRVSFKGSGGGELEAGGAGEAGGGAGGGAPLSLRGYLGLRMVVTCIAVIFYFYPSVTDSILSILQCEQLDTDQEAYGQYAQAKGSFWEMDYGLHCYRSQHLVLAAAVGFPGLVLFCLGVPAASAAWLRHSARRGRLNDRDFSDRYGFLYEDYSRQYYFWESVIMLRKLLVVGLLIVTNSEDDIVQVLSVLGVVVFAGALHAVCRPFETPRFNRLESLSLGATALILYLSCFFLVDLPDRAKEGLSVIIVLINVGMLGWFCYCVAIEAWSYTVRVLDTDGDGKVTQAEVRAWLREKLGGPLAGLVGWVAAKGRGKGSGGGGGGEGDGDGGKDGGEDGKDGEWASKSQAAKGCELVVVGRPGRSAAGGGGGTALVPPPPRPLRSSKTVETAAAAAAPGSGVVGVTSSSGAGAAATPVVVMSSLPVVESVTAPPSPSAVAAAAPAVLLPSFSPKKASGGGGLAAVTDTLDAQLVGNGGGGGGSNGDVKGGRNSGGGRGSSTSSSSSASATSPSDLLGPPGALPGSPILTGSETQEAASASGGGVSGVSGGRAGSRGSEGSSSGGERRSGGSSAGGGGDAGGGGRSSANRAAGPRTGAVLEQ
ncbi:hypothetical protein Agub_g141 [Astrephomene gubernaculifera]|uniref:EF-hand domain-containing protein n=1 Tax=Astrephomene gubernaculifera TaxID=47775 RepID=A0AAD3DDC3_9CHLO|nr:hypothetical protein Agub_g141 [Astrephomene gubernaculifera]